MGHRVVNRHLGESSNMNQHCDELAEQKLTTAVMQKVKYGFSSNSQSAFLISISHDCSNIAATHGDHRIYVWDLSNGKLLDQLDGHPGSLLCVQFHPHSNDILASGCLAGKVNVWHLQGGSKIWRSPNSVPISSLAFHPSQQLLVIAAGSCIYFWNWDNPRPEAFVSTNCVMDKVRYVKFDRLGHKLITAISNKKSQGDIPDFLNLDYLLPFENDSEDELEAPFITFSTPRNIIGDEASVYVRRPRVIRDVDEGEDSIETVEHPVLNETSNRRRFIQFSAPEEPEMHIENSSNPRSIVFSAPEEPEMNIENSSNPRSIVFSAPEQPVINSGSSFNFRSVRLSVAEPPRMNNPRFRRSIQFSTPVVSLSHRSNSPERQNSEEFLSSSDVSGTISRFGELIREIESQLGLYGDSSNKNELDSVTQMDFESYENENDTEFCSAKEELVNLLNLIAEIRSSLSSAVPALFDQTSTVDPILSLNEVNRTILLLKEILTNADDMNQILQFTNVRAIEDLFAKLETLLILLTDNLPKILELAKRIVKMQLNAKKCSTSKLKRAHKKSSQKAISPAAEQISNQSDNVEDTVLPTADRNVSNNPRRIMFGPSRLPQNYLSRHRFNPISRRPLRRNLNTECSCESDAVSQTCPVRCPLSRSRRLSGRRVLIFCPRPAQNTQLQAGGTEANLSDVGSQNDSKSSRQNLSSHLSADNAVNTSTVCQDSQHPSSGLNLNNQTSKDNGAANSFNVESETDQGDSENQIAAKLIKCDESNDLPSSLPLIQEEELSNPVSHNNQSDNSGVNSETLTITLMLSDEGNFPSFLPQDVPSSATEASLEEDSGISNLNPPPSESSSDAYDWPPDFQSFSYQSFAERSGCPGPISQSHRIQAWDIFSSNLPEISNTTANVVVPRCLIHNDTSVDVSRDGEKVVCLIPDDKKVSNGNLMLGVFSLKKEDFGSCLCVWGYISHIISVNFSPTSQYVLAGSANSKSLFVDHANPCSVQIIKLNNDGCYEPVSVRSFMLPLEEYRFEHPGVSSVKWLPQPGAGFAVAGKKGGLTIFRPESGEFLREKCKSAEHKKK